MVDVVRQTIAEEMGIALEDVAGPVELSGLGMDSLMALTILGILREKFDKELSGSFFVDNPTIDDIRKTLIPEHKNNAPPPPRAIEAKLALSKPGPSAQSIVLQGSLKSSTKNLFLFPDGSGAAAAYAPIPQTGDDVAVIAMNCPFLKIPEEFTTNIGIEGVSSIYIEELKRRQGKGPYYLAGWSAGGVIAYEVAKQLIAEGAAVERLIVFDSPCPIRLEPLQQRIHKFFGEIGLFGDANGIPGWLIPHFDSTIASLTIYEPQPIAQPPRTYASWATKGMCGEPDSPRLPPQEDDPKSMRWLLDNQTDFGTNGWEKLLGNDITCGKVEGNHFTIMSNTRLLGSLRDFICAAMSD